MKRLIIGAFLFSLTCAGAKEAPVWEETFENYNPGPLIGQHKRWYLDSDEEGAEKSFTIVESPDGGNALAIRKSAKNDRLGMIFRPHTASETESNCTSITFRAGENVSSSLLVNFYADNGTTQVASLRFDPSGEIILYREKNQKDREVLPFLWVRGEWNRVEVTVFPGKEETVIRLLDMGGAVQNTFSTVLHRNNPGELMPWWAMHFSQTGISDIPWLVRSVTLENSPSPEN